MNRITKTLLNIVIAIAGIGLGLWIISGFSLLDYTKRIIVAAVVIVIVAAVFITYAVTMRKQNKKVLELLDILYVKLDAERFIEESLALLETVKNGSYRKTLMLNLAVGYESNCQFDKAIQTMEQISVKGADSTLKAMYYCNLACFYAESGNNDKALLTFKQGEKFINQAEKKLPEANLLLTKGIIAYAEGELKKSLRCFKSAKEAGFEEKQLTYYADAYIGKILVADGREKEGQNILDRISRKKVLPYIKNTITGVK